MLAVYPPSTARSAGDLMGYVYLYYGTGGGKTANALGLALRSVGHDRRVVIIQFMKYWTDIGEYKVRERLKPNYEIYQFGNPGWIGPAEEGGEMHSGGMTLEVRGPNESDRAQARKAIEFSEKILTEDMLELLILDEACLAVHLGLLPEEDLLKILQRIPERTDVVLTGRYAPKKVIDRADFVNEIVERKSPKNFVMTRGIQY